MNPITRKSKLLWALFIAAIINLINSLLVYSFGFFDGWKWLKDVFYYGVSTIFLWFWFALLVLIQEAIYTNRVKDSKQDEDMMA